ncbi:LuxR C-terminal-related transcriptional regulator [Agromyces sp. NPDC056523]|uniref:LuxR C-terminal-related transcriptional regulator n=1 Tax=Agromyces sp. NPDC056523 TaxID=3345850 RepID=UPI00366CE328
MRARASALLGDASDVDLAYVRELTGGHSRLVDLVLIQLRDDGAALDRDADLPDAIVVRVAEGLETLDPDVREFLLAQAVGFSAAASALATAPRFAATDTRALLASARAHGLAASDGSLPPIVRLAVLRTALPDEAWTLRRELVDAVEASGEPLSGIADLLARDGYSDPRVAGALEARADSALPTAPRTATQLYELAIAAGADASGLDARRATAAWAIGDIRTAERLVDGLLRQADGADLCRAVPVAAAVWAREGLLERSASAYERLAGAECALGPLAATCLALVGDVERSRSVRLRTDPVPYPASSHVATELAADGVVAAIEGDGDRALALLLRASSVMTDSAEIVPLPEAPAVLAALVASNLGEVGIADEVVETAIDGGQGGPAFRARLLLTRALVALRADRPLHARAHLDAAEADFATCPPGLRDELLAAAVRVALARHQGEIPLLMRAWQAARPAIASMQVDVTTLPVLAELAVAAARVGEMPLVQPHLQAAWGLLDRMGHPASWSTALHWAEIGAALLRNEPTAVEQHAAALEAIDGSRTAGRLARAGRTWAAALAGEVTVDAVERAVEDLMAAGYPWDAGRLAGHAAARAAEHRDTLHLLALARSLHADESDEPMDRPDAPAAQADRSGATGPAAGDGIRLSAREREVARLVLAGKTYAEIGAAIFISPRTAEHHIARIRRRLGASNRSDLMARLRLELEDD